MPRWAPKVSEGDEAQDLGRVILPNDVFGPGRNSGVLPCRGEGAHSVT